MNEQDLNKDLQQAIEKVLEDDNAGHTNEELLSNSIVVETGAEEGTLELKKKAEKQSLKEDISGWFYTFMCMNIPIIGWIYLLRLAFGKRHPEKRSFARAYLIYKLVFFLIGFLILAVLAYAALDVLDELLAYMEML